MSQQIQSVTIGIGVKNVAEAAEWYKSLLGDVETMEPDPGTVELKLTDDLWLQLDDTGYLQAGGESVIIRLQTDDILAAHNRASDLSAQVGDIEVVPDVVKYFDFKDPSGNRLSFVQVI